MLHIYMFSSHVCFGLGQEREKNSGHRVTGDPLVMWTSREVPVDPLSMETLARRPQQADEVHKGGGESFGPCSVASSGGQFFLTPLKLTVTMENHTIFLDVFLNRRDTSFSHGCFSIVMVVSGRVRYVPSTKLTGEHVSFREDRV